MKNIIVIGCGAVLEQCHRLCLQQLARKLNFRVVGLVDTNPQRLVMAQQWFPNAQGFPDAQACFAAVPDVLLTIITSPPPLHAAHAQVAFAHGSHVLCEKPLAGSLQDAQQITQAAGLSGKLLALGMTRRFYPCLREAQRRILSGQWGKAIRFAYREGGAYGWPVASAAPFRRQTSGGGVLLDKGVHALDALSFLFGGGCVTSSSDDGPLESVEANVIAQLQFERASGTMQLSWDMSLHSGLHVWSELGEFWIPLGSLDLIFSRQGASSQWRQEKVRVEWPLDLQAQHPKLGCPIDYNDCFHFQLVQTLRAILLGEAPPASAQEGLATIRLIENCYQKALPLAKPWLSAAEQQAICSHHWRSVRA